MSLFTDPTLVMDETTAETPLGWSPSIAALPAPVRRAGHAHHHQPLVRRPRRWWWAPLATACAACLAALAWALPAAWPAITVLNAGGLP